MLQEEGGMQKVIDFLEDLEEQEKDDPSPLEKLLNEKENGTSLEDAPEDKPNILLEDVPIKKKKSRQSGKSIDGKTNKEMRKSSGKTSVCNKKLLKKRK